MASHHPPRACFISLDFNDWVKGVTAYFTEGQIYSYSLIDFAPLYAQWKENRGGTWFNANVRNTTVPFSRIPSQ